MPLPSYVNVVSPPPQPVHDVHDVLGVVVQRGVLEAAAALADAAPVVTDDDEPPLGQAAGELAEERERAERSGRRVVAILRAGPGHEDDRRPAARGRRARRRRHRRPEREPRRGDEERLITRIADVLLSREDRRVRLEVRDTGTGIPAEELPRLFERFHQVRGARARVREGTGIGLALARELVRLHGGQLGVTSELGRGTTFTVTIPLGREHLPPERVGTAGKGAADAAQTRI